jgi:hypothetical protein
MEEASKLDWGRFKAVVVTRHSMHSESIHDLYRMNLRILNHLPYPKHAVQNPPAFHYLIHCIEHYRNDYDWVINIDDDAFLTDFKALYDLMDHMEREGYDICGMPDGLTYTPRDVFNPCSMNPFFNVIQMKTFRQKFATVQDMIAPYHPGLLKHLDFSVMHPEMWGKRSGAELQGSEFPIGYEPYYPFFYALLPKAKMLWLYGRSYTFDGYDVKDVIIPDEPRRTQMWWYGKKGVTYDDDPWTTELRNHEGTSFILHTWYARSYGHGEDPTMPIIPNTARIDRIYELACKRLGLPLQDPPSEAG